MGTRGAWGFYKDGVTKVTYNHYDSYPEGLGSSVVKFLVGTSTEELNEIFDRIVMVDEDSVPTDEQIKECDGYCDLGVGAQSTQDWYCLLRNAQGNPVAYKDGLKYMIDNEDFLQDSLFCEYAYIINLDENVLEFYVGFQKKPTDSRYYKGDEYENYYPVKLQLCFAFDDIKEHGCKQIIDEMDKEDA